jgi:hypothetical protein
MTTSLDSVLDLAKVREELVGKPLLGFETATAGVEGLQKLSNAKIGAKPSTDDR